MSYNLMSWKTTESGHFLVRGTCCFISIMFGSFIPALMFVHLLHWSCVVCCIYIMFITVKIKLTCPEDTLLVIGCNPHTAQIIPTQVNPKSVKSIIYPHNPYPWNLPRSQILPSLQESKASRGLEWTPHLHPQPHLTAVSSLPEENVQERKSHTIIHTRICLTGVSFNNLTRLLQTWDLVILQAGRCDSVSHHTQICTLARHPAAWECQCCVCSAWTWSTNAQNPRTRYIPPDSHPADVRL